MLEACEQVVLFVKERVRGDLDSDPQFRMALLRAIEVLGEAASRVSPETRATYPQIPWQHMTSTRNRLIHAYFDIDLNIVWTTATHSVPELLPTLKEILGPEKPV